MKKKGVVIGMRTVNLQQKRVLVVGSGMSGIAAVKLLTQVGAEPILYDSNEVLDQEAVREKLGDAGHCKMMLGRLSEKEAASIELVVLSPGVSADTEFVEQFRRRSIPIWGEVELGYAFSKGRVIAITGTNGKTTTTALVGKILRDYYDSVFVVGNIGNPYTLEALHTTADTVTVAEISSFQLETIQQFRPDISAILNITPDHLNRHNTMENYVSVKESITKNQTKENICVLNYRDAYTREFGSRCPAHVVYFSSTDSLQNGYCLEADEIFFVTEGKKQRLLSMQETKLLGVHNAENIMAAIAMTVSCGVPMEQVLQSVKEFRAVEHRIEYVATKRGVDYYNDSKGTNPDAAIQAIRAMNRPTVLIGGGYDKESAYDSWIEAFEGKVKCLVLLGQTKEKIAECARQHGFTAIRMADSLKEAMDICVEQADCGDAVLLSPACASWGMFPSYEVRGSMFKEYVNQIEE